MAKELRHEQMRAAVVGDAQAEFRNDSSKVLHIRGIDLSLLATALGLAEHVTMEVSKAPTVQSTVANSPFFLMILRVASQKGIAIDDANVGHRSKRWGRGQLTLEPNESLFINSVISGAPALVANAELEYEF